ncbi:uncharacterized protein PV09_07381 [Verruconis gallopava]|uniref:Uncharacterized protein n=1 Tax=Verruconis gallopava TaxID=253628 RepID=A0A0D2APL0_9PEZI|nr:uncharacterized protein PV09_07381 [Verruconis gallopava]KIW01094.1 hypothetical protein PV09_07381 [Verruconis gallopava]
MDQDDSCSTSIMSSTSNQSRPFLSRQRSNSVPAFGLVNVSAEEAGMIFSAAERATARRKRPLSVDSPGPVVEKDYDPSSLPATTFNFSTPSRLGLGASPLRNVQRSESVRTLQSDSSSATLTTNGNEDEIEPTPLASTFPASAAEPTNFSLPSSQSSRRMVDNPVLKAYADGLFRFTQNRLNSAAPETLRTLGLRRDPSLPSTPDLDVNELPRPTRPVFRSQFSDWSSTRASSVAQPSSPSTPSEPLTPSDEHSNLMTPDSFFAEITPRVAQTAQWAASLSLSRTSSNNGNGSTFLMDSPTIGMANLERTDSVTSSEAFSYFAGFDSVSEAAGTRLSNDMSPYGQHLRTPSSNFLSRSQPSSSASNHPPYNLHQQAQSPYGEMKSLSRTPSWQVPALG